MQSAASIWRATTEQEKLPTEYSMGKFLLYYSKRVLQFGLTLLWSSSLFALVSLGIQITSIRNELASPKGFLQSFYVGFLHGIFLHSLFLAMALCGYVSFKKKKIIIGIVCEIILLTLFGASVIYRDYIDIRFLIWYFYLAAPFCFGIWSYIGFRFSNRIATVYG
jgi:hypothetical protein